MVAEKLSDEEIRELWAHHFPKRLKDPKSQTLCLAFCLIIEGRAARNASPDEDALDRVHTTLAVLGVPSEEYYQVQLECPEIDDA